MQDFQNCEHLLSYSGNKAVDTNNLQFTIIKCSTFNLKYKRFDHIKSLLQKCFAKSAFAGQCCLLTMQYCATHTV